MDFTFTYVATCRRSELPPEPPEAIYCAAPLVGHFEPGNGHDEEIAAMLVLVSFARSQYKHLPIRPEELWRAAQRAVMGIDFRPLCANGERLAVGAPAEAHSAAEAACKEVNLCAWFLMRFEEWLQ